MDLSDLRPNPKARKSRKRIGRGASAGQGKTAGRGEKGQKHRYSIKPGFEGGQTPLYRRLPMMRGITNKAHNIGIFRSEFAVVNVGSLAEKFDADAEITPETLLASGLISKVLDGVKILGTGTIDKPLTVRAHAFSASAREKIEAANGTAEVIGQ
ncbi:MAG: 50S ribosomal protein L15 [candidate division WS1 bacterium]|jgi:large subunit ribosomal protein L15|nr:50S ribosomal protein L15 [candidate division WS1 bacterium]